MKNFQKPAIKSAENRSILIAEKCVSIHSLLMRMNQKLKCIFTERENFLFASLSRNFVRYEKIVHETEKEIIPSMISKKSFHLVCAVHD